MFTHGFIRPLRADLPPDNWTGADTGGFACVGPKSFLRIKIEMSGTAKKFWTALSVGGLLLAAASAQAGDGLTRQQNWAVLYASVVGNSYYAEPLPRNYAYERTLTAVLTQESSLCHHKRGMDKQSYGCGQLQKRTAKLVNGEPVSAHKLQHNDALNIRLAARYLAYCMQQMGTWERSVICYNKGPYRAKSMTDKQVAKDAYLHSIRHRMDEAQDLLANID